MSWADVKDPRSLSTRLRKRRDIRLRELIAKISQERGSVRILDMGGTVSYWRRVGPEFLREQKVKIILLNLHASELKETEGVEDLIETAVGNACDLSMFADNAFDLAHSNSVIEHVVTWQNMQAFARETRRVAKYYYVQTPYFWFPIDPHFYQMPFFHWYPRPIRARMLNRFSLTYSGRIKDVGVAYEVLDNAKLLDGRQFRFLFPDTKVTFERFLGLPKSLMAIKGP